MILPPGEAFRVSCPFFLVSSSLFSCFVSVGNAWNSSPIFLTAPPERWNCSWILAVFSPFSPSWAPRRSEDSTTEPPATLPPYPILVKTFTILSDRCGTPDRPLFPRREVSPSSFVTLAMHDFDTLFPEDTIDGSSNSPFQVPFFFSFSPVLARRLYDSRVSTPPLSFRKHSFLKWVPCFFSPHLRLGSGAFLP